MRAEILFLIGAAALGTGQQLSLPACAQSCVTNAINETGCDATDIQCICTGGKTGTDIGTLSQSCVSQACSAADLAAATAYYEQICSSGSSQSPAPTSLASSTGGSGTAAATASTRPSSSTDAGGGTTAATLPSSATETAATGSTKLGASQTGASVGATATAGTFTSGGNFQGATNGGGLSTGAKAGIAVGVVLAAAALALLAFFLVRRNRKRSANASWEVHVGPPELGNTEFKGHEVSSEPPKYGPIEMATTQPHVTGYELDASPRGPGEEVAELAAMPVASMAIFFPHSDSDVAAHTQTPPGGPGWATGPIVVPQGPSAGGDHSTSQHAAPASVEEQGAMFTGTDPSAAELEQMLKENDELEQRRKTLEELKALQDQQAALKERIKAAQARSTPGS